MDECECRSAKMCSETGYWDEGVCDFCSTDEPEGESECDLSSTRE